MGFSGSESFFARRRCRLMKMNPMKKKMRVNVLMPAPMPALAWEERGRDGGIGMSEGVEVGVFSIMFVDVAEVVVAGLG